MNKNENYLKEYLAKQLTDVLLEINQLESEPNQYNLEKPQWQTNGYYDSLLFRRDWLGIQINDLNK